MNEPTPPDAKPISALALGVVCLAVILLEISYTRLISFKLFYYYTYLVIGFALLGIGSGGVLVSVFPRFVRVPLERMVAAGSLAASLAIALGYAVVAMVPGVRSLNLSNAVAVAVYEAWRQHGFSGSR